MIKTTLSLLKWGKQLKKDKIIPTGFKILWDITSHKWWMVVTSTNQINSVEQAKIQQTVSKWIGCNMSNMNALKQN